ncbi:MAG: hypothetical protein MUC33_01210 [Desulfobacterales bacterium]|jgi:hypothetical protein|nr:hypothetical protein [Desulfobacterales bacterium]MCU0601261.1 hypothetical protein [Desulfobacterales bacterium]
MANREACELYIEQEIKSALEDGKKPWTIGKELAAWVEKLFEVTISPHTLRMRAKRIEENNLNRCSKKSNTATKSPTYEPINTPSKPPITSVTHPPTARGGAREGAGRPVAGQKAENETAAWGEVCREIERFGSFLKKRIKFPVSDSVPDSLLADVCTAFSLIEHFSSETREALHERKKVRSKKANR